MACPARFVCLLLTLFLGTVSAAAAQDLIMLHSSDSRFVGTVQRAFPFEPFSGASPIALSFEVRLVVLVRVDRWLDKPDEKPVDGKYAIFLDNPRTWFGHLPSAWSGKAFTPVGKTWLFTLTTTTGHGRSYALKVDPLPKAPTPAAFAVPSPAPAPPGLALPVPQPRRSARRAR